ncbi:serine aminopeptidase, S33 [Nitzschia inconspicua]|uniref:Serine aminopeptidase, S33 n=1 Tax=Nitzschia inconspicua TaxID=303405 RepID=A0A9K3PJD5_9STRA|nr:serine aminopeptidase, S33 [Nitzschia inconspicua]
MAVSPSYSISQSVEDLKEVIWQVVAPNHTSFHLYGHSFGGVLAYEYLSFCLSDDRHAQYSQKSALPTCRSVMLSNTPNDLGRCNRDYDRMYAKNPLLFWQQHVCRVGTPPPLQDAMKHMGTVWTGMDVVAGYREAPLPHKKENDEMIPLLVISCTRDFAFDTSNGNVWVSLLSQNSSGHREFVTLENAAHYPFYENKTAYGEILCEFLSHVELQLSKR